MKAPCTLILLLALLIVPGNAVAQNDNALLWQITGPGIIRPSYLFGTMHLLCPDQLVVTEAVEAAIEQTEQIYLEIDMDDPDLHRKMQKGMLLPQGKTLPDYCTPNTFTTIDSFFNYAAHIPTEPYLAYKPMVLMQALYVTMLGCQPASWERTISEMAANQHKEILGLETVEMQLELFDSIPFNIQLEWLKEYAVNIAKMTTNFHKMVEMYQAEQVDSLSQMIKKSPEFHEYYDILMDRRNRNWVDQIATLSPEDPVFFAVGAGHLGGKSGVVQLLRDKGFKVTAVK